MSREIFGIDVALYIVRLRNINPKKGGGKVVKLLGKLSNGEKVWYDEQWVFFEKNGDFNEYTSQPVAKDSLQYGYTHGGKLYQEACELFWEMEEA